MGRSISLTMHLLRPAAAKAMHADSGRVTMQLLQLKAGKTMHTDSSWLTCHQRRSWQSARPCEQTAAG